MKSKFIVLAVLICASLQAQKVERDVGEFSKLKVFDLIETKLIKSDENKVIISGRNTEDVKVINQNGILKIRMNLEERFDGNETFVKVYYTDVDVLDANEGAEIDVKEPINKSTMELRAQEGGKIIVELDANHTKVKAVTGGIIEASGSSNNLEISLGTGGIYEGEYLKSQTATVSITAAGEAEVNASESIKVRVTAGGDVTIYGNPAKIDKKTIAGGRIYVVD